MSDTIQLDTRVVKAAGWFYLGIILTSILSLAFLGGKYTVMSDNAATVASMVENVVWVRINAAYESIMFSAVIVLAVLLFELTKGISAPFARSAMLLRVGEAILGYAGVVLTIGALSVAGPGGSGGGNASLAVALLDLKDIVYMLLMICISGGTIVFFALFHKAKLLPRLLTIWGMTGFSLMLLSSLMQFLEVPGGGAVNGGAAALAITFEFVVGAWLLIKGVRRSSSPVS